jgi:4-amino-4-deoxy-L-arabinose transferase-like glycosyltransferase
LAFYLFTFNVGGYERFFYSVDGKVEYEQMKAIIGGSLSLFLSPYKHLGLSLAEIPFYFVGEWLSQLLHMQLNPIVTLLVNPFVAALLCFLMFLIVRILSCQKTALIITFLYGFCTLVWPYSKSDVADPLFTLCSLSVFWALLHYSRSNRLVWFILSLLFMAANYTAKLTGHGFILGWLFYIYISSRNNGVSLNKIILRSLLVILLWGLFIPLSLSVNQAHSQSYTWSWFHRIGHKFLVREFSPLDGLFWYCPLLFLVLFSTRPFIKRFVFEFIFIILLILPFFITLHLGKDIVCIYDFGGRYDMVYAPFLLILLIPLVENFSRYNLFARLVCIFIFFFGFYVQLLGSSVSILYYANLVGQSLARDWQPYWFAWQYSPFGIYPRLIFQAITGVSVPINGIDVSPASIDLPFKLDYFWAMNNSISLKVMAFLLAITIIVLGIYLFRSSNVFSSFKKYGREVIIVVAVFFTSLVVIFVPKELFLNRKIVPVHISNAGFEVFYTKSGKVFPDRWELFDCSGQNGTSSLDFVANYYKKIEGEASLEIIPNQNTIIMSLASPFFDVSPGEIVEARLLVSKNNAHYDTIRIAFNRKAGDVFYYSPTTKIRDFNDNWKEMVCKVLVPKKAIKARVYFNIWGPGINTNERILLDDLRVIKYI